MYVKDALGQRHQNVSYDMPYDEVTRRLREAIGDYFKLELGRPEILNRIGENIVIFDFIRQEAGQAILRAQVDKLIRRLKEQGVFVYCADMDGVPLRKNNLTGPIALVLGSEGSGVSQLVKKLCDGVVRLDMAAQGTGVDSYNVSVAAGIILYEIQSQRAAQNA